MSFSNNYFIGRITLAAAISALLQIILLVLMFTVSRKLFGTASDYFYALTPLLILPFMVVFPKIMSGQNLLFSRIARLLGIIGILIASIAQIILLFKIIDLKQSIWGNLVGLGLIGIPVFIMSLHYLSSHAIPTGFNWFGIVLGIAMVIGIPAGFFFLDELHAVQNGTLVWAETSPLIYPAVLAGVITQIGFPVWLLWTARLILTAKINIF